MTSTTFVKFCLVIKNTIPAKILQNQNKENTGCEQSDVNSTAVHSVLILFRKI